jgi:hypothetical protein
VGAVRVRYTGDPNGGLAVATQLSSMYPTPWGPPMFHVREMVPEASEMEVRNVDASVTLIPFLTVTLDPPPTVRTAPLCTLRLVRLKLAVGQVVSADMTTSSDGVCASTAENRQSRATSKCKLLRQRTGVGAWVPFKATKSGKLEK